MFFDSTGTVSFRRPPHGQTDLHLLPSARSFKETVSSTTLTYCDGVRGAFVVYDPNDPFANLYDIDDAPELELPKHDSTLINGPVGFDFERLKTSLLTGPNNSWKDNDSPTPLAVITVEQDKRYRMRVVNIACQPDYEFWIEDHDMPVIEADGIKHQPVQAGQLDVNQPVGKYRSSRLYLFRGNNLIALLTPLPRDSCRVRAPDEESIDGDFEPQNELKESVLRPLENPGAPGQPFPGGVDHAINLHCSTSSERFFINDVSFMNPPIDILQVLSGARTVGELLPPGSIYELPGPNKTIEISFTGGGIKGFEHPIHLHGIRALHAFDVVRVAGSDVYNFENPVRRDTVNSGKGRDNVTIRFVTDNSGPWFLHCHIDWHLETGFAAVMAERTPGWHDVIHPPAEWF
ncbi:laccase 3 [Moniliophthora roreri]|nr:laccase 3 [Moniliophthora roreri]